MEEEQPRPWPEMAKLVHMDFKGSQGTSLLGSMGCSMGGTQWPPTQNHLDLFPAPWHHQQGPPALVHRTTESLTRAFLVRPSGRMWLSCPPGCHSCSSTRSTENGTGTDSLLSHLWVRNPRSEWGQERPSVRRDLVPGDRACDEPGSTWHTEEEPNVVTVSPGHSPGFEGKGQSQALNDGARLRNTGKGA